MVRPSTIARLVRFVVLPAESTPFEATHLRRMNQIALGFFWLHLPILMLVAVLAGTSPLLALVLGLVVLVGPVVAYSARATHPRLVSLVHGAAAMLMGGVLVYVGQGPMQIEMHFYFFVLLGILAVFGNPLVVVVAAVTVTAHHVVVWILYPRAVFNYDASVWTVVVHGLFVVVEAIAASFIARVFFDHVIGLERIVASRTDELDARNHDMARILDHVAQGLVTVKIDGSMDGGQSRAMTRWFGEPLPEARIWSYLAGHDVNLEAWIELAFDGLRVGLLPRDVAIAQLPDRLSRDGRAFRLEYRAIGVPLTGLLVVVSDITAELARQRVEGEQRELIAIVENAYRDRIGFFGFLREADEIVRECAGARDDSLVVVKRRLHTLKGNAALFGVHSVAAVCHQLESQIDEHGEAPDAAGRALLVESWNVVRNRLDSVLGLSARRSILVDWDEYQSVLAALGEPEPAWAAPMRRWGQVATRTHLERFAEQARRLAGRLGKADVDVEILDHDVHLDGEQFAPVWSALVHTVRNALGHGIETTEVRLAAGKPARGQLTLVTEVVDAQVVIEIRDDGAGVDWARVAARARALGLPAGSPTDLQHALFASDLSTATEVTDLSGRGIGLAALRAVCAAAGGALEVISELGQGTTVRCRLPLADPRAISERPGPRPVATRAAQ